MHPIDKHNFGVTGIKVRFYNGSGEVDGYVVKQTATNRFIVTDGTLPRAFPTTRSVRLAPTSAIAADLTSNPTYCTIPVEPPNLTATGATFHVHYKVDAATVVDGGSHFNVTDVLTLPGGGGGALTVATRTGTAIATVTVSTPGDYADTLFTEPVTATRAAGSGAAFTAHYAVDSATVVSGGTNFNVGDVLTLGTGAGALTVATLSSTAIATVTVSTPGDYSRTDITGALAGTQTATRARGSGAAFTCHYKVESATVAVPGTGYAVGDLLNVTGSTGTVLRVRTITGGGGTGPVDTVDFTAGGAAGSEVDLALLVGTVHTVAQGGTGDNAATFTLTMNLLSVTANGAGSGYNVGDTLTFTDMVGATLPTARISVVTVGHAITTIEVLTQGDALTVAATNASIVTSTTTATFTLKYNLLSVATDGAGSGYNVGEQLVFTGMTATTMPTAQISVATGHAATTVTNTPGAGITATASAIAGSANTATFNHLKYKVLSVASSGGTGYAVNDTVSFNGMVATTMPVAYISTATDTHATAVTSTTGAGITTAASSVTVNGLTENVCRIWDTKLLTTDGNTYFWTLRQSVNGSAIIVTYS